MPRDEITVHVGTERLFIPPASTAFLTDLFLGDCQGPHLLYNISKVSVVQPGPQYLCRHLLPVKAQWFLNRFELQPVLHQKG